MGETAECGSMLDPCIPSGAGRSASSGDTGGSGVGPPGERDSDLWITIILAVL